MTSRIIEYGGDQWKATADGLGVGVSTDRPASVTHLEYAVQVCV